MKRTFLEVWDRLRGSYWLLPGAMALGAVVLAVAAVWADLTWARGLLADRLPWLVYNHPDGARALLTSIAGSMITVAGVTFSITIVAVAYVSSQLGPRVLDAFMRDRGNQATLGTFIATFIYCLLVLRTVRSPEEDGVGFVPEMAVLVAFFLALASVGVLIYFINHVLLSIHASHVIAAIGHDLEAKMEAIFPEPLDHHAGEDDDEEEAVRVPAALQEEGVALRARNAGYVTHIGQESLVKLARDRDLVVEILVRPGAFVRVGTEVVRVHPAGNADEEVNEEILEAVHVGRRRTQTQDVLFLINELAEITGRALSPGVNDPFTAMTCLDWLGAGLGRMAVRPRPRPYRTDEEGVVRVVAPPTDLSRLVEDAFGQVRPYVERDRNAALRMMRVLGDLAATAPRGEDRRAILGQADALLKGAEAALGHEDDVEAVRSAHRTAVTGARRGDRDAPRPGLRLHGDESR